jgi:hypothetical protein
MGIMDLTGQGPVLIVDTKSPVDFDEDYCTDLVSFCTIGLKGQNLPIPSNCVK